MKSKVIVILGICLLAAACQKRKYPEDKIQLQKEDIYVNGYVDNAPISLAIGTNGYYCYSSYKQGSDSVYMFEGELRKFDCNPCPLSLRVALSDYRQRLPGSSVPVDSAFRTGSRVFIPGASRVNTLRLVSHSNKGVSSIRWKASDGASSQDSIWNCEFGQPGPQTLSLTVRTKDNCESMVVNKIFVSGDGSLFACVITAQALQNTGAEFSSGIIGGKAPYLYTWDFGDGSRSTLPAPGHTFNLVGSYPVKLCVTDSENHVCEANYIYVAGNDKSSCATFMSLSQTGGSRNAGLNGVKIQWTDEWNVVFRSDSVAQPAESYFEVVNSQPYEANERGEAGRLLSLRFNVLLQGGNRKIWFKSENTAIAVTYK